MTESSEGRTLSASIVIPVFNNLALTKDCLDSVRACTAPSTYEIIVVDNGSSDGTWEYLQSLQPDIRSLRNPQNLFFARGCNRGAWAATAENIVFLNNDTIVTPNWLDELVRPLLDDATIGITGNKQLFPDYRVWHAGTVVGQDKLPWHVCYGFDRTHPAVNMSRDCASVSGCCLAIRRDLFRQLGGFDPHFENGFEDADLCLRAGSLGYRTVYTPRSEIIHLVSQTPGRFDREDANREKFKARWVDKLVPDESEFLHAAGFLGRSNDSALRIGYIAASAECCPLSNHAQDLMKSYTADSTFLLGEFGSTNGAQDARVIPCWDRAGLWFYPLLRWSTTLDLDLIHIHFDAFVFPPTFLELLQALKRSGSVLVFTLHRFEKLTPLLAGILQLADGIVVDREKQRVQLIQMGCPPAKLHVIKPPGAEQYRLLYTEVLAQRTSSPTRVRWEGPQLVNHSLALVNRELELALLKTGKVELTITPTSEDTFSRALNSRVRLLPAHYGCALTGSAEVHVRHQWPPNWTAPAEGRWVVIQPWEYGAVPEDWVGPINREVDELWAPSNFVRNLYIESGVEASRVHVVPNGVDTDFFKPGGRRFPLKSARGFKFLFLGGTIHRKGIDVLLDAYCRSFKAADDVTLVIKDMGVSNIYRGQGMGDRIRQLQSQPDTPHILYLESDLSDEQMVELYNACDCLVHPYRGEGFALPVLEAMACALPVVVTAGGATDDFVDDETGYRIPSRKQVFGDRCISGLKTAGDLWLLEPDVDALRSTLTQIFQNRESSLEVGRRARAKVEAGWTWQHAAERALARMESIRTSPPLRHMKRADAAVLLDGICDQDLEAVLDSIRRHTYASLAIFVRRSGDANAVCDQHADVEFLDHAAFPDVLKHIRSSVRAPYFALVTEPIRFSKHWLGQLAEVAGTASRDPNILIPSSDIQNAAELDDNEFQRQARRQWRERRGQYRAYDGAEPACALLSWSFLSMQEGVSKDGKAWLAQLTHGGAATYLAEDTCVGLLQSEKVVVTI